MTVKGFRKAPTIAQLMERAKSEFTPGVPTGVIQSVYRGMPDLVRKEASMVMIPSHYKAGKLYGMQPRPQKNLLQYSERFEVSSVWNRINGTPSVVSNATAAPDGSVTADLLKNDASSGNSGFYQIVNVNCAINSPVTYSIYMKANIGTANIVWGGSSNIVGGTITSTDVGNGWFRYQITGNATYGRIAYVQITVNPLSSVYVWGAQLEKGATATAYQPTNASENLLKYSEQFDNAVWGKFLLSSVNTNIVVAPDGSQTADGLAEDASTGSHEVQYLLSGITDNADYTYSVYLKYSTKAWVELTVRKKTSTATWGRAWFNLQTGVKGSLNVNAISSTMTDVGNGWYRCTITANMDNGGSAPTLYVTPRTADNVSSGYAGTNGVVAVYVWGAQLNYGSTALPYTKTTYSNTDGWVNHSDFDFSRSSNATVVGSDGLIQYAPHNLLQRSEEFDNGMWAKAELTLTPNATTAPDGTLTADKFVESTTANANHQIFAAGTNQIAVIGGMSYTASVYVKSAGRTGVLLALAGTSNVFPDTYILDITNDPKSSSVGNGWYRVSVSGIASITGSAILYIATIGNAGNKIYTGDGVSGVYLWGAQINVGSRLLDYVQTTSAALYAPRFQFDPVTKQYQGLLMEKASTNLATWSEEFTGANTWGVYQGVRTNNTHIAPDGTLTADSYVESVANDVHQAFTRSNFAVTGTSPLTFSLFVKDMGRDCRIKVFDNAATTNTFSGYFDMVNNTVIAANGGGTATGITAGVQPYGNGWYRIWVSGTLGSGTTATIELWLSGTRGTVTTTYTGDVTKGIIFWGAQLEQSSVPTSYIPTLGASATRAADLCETTNLNNWYKEDEGTFFVDAMSGFSEPNANLVFQVGFNPTRAHYIMQYGASVTRIGLTYDDLSNSNMLQAASNTVQPGIRLKAAYAFKKDNIGGSLNGGAVLTDTVADIFTGTSKATIGYTLGNTQYLNSTIKTIAFFSTRRTNAELQTMTS